MKIRLFHDGEPFDVTIDGSSDEKTVVIEGAGETRRYQMTSVADGTSAGAFRLDGLAIRHLAVRDGSRIRVAVRGESFEFDLADSASRGHGGHGTRSPETRSPMPGKVLQVSVAVGGRVEAGDPLLILEAMKMENVLCAEIGGTVAEVHVSAGDMVEPGKVLVVVRADE